MAQSFDRKPIEDAHIAAQQAADQKTAAPHIRRWRSVLFQGYLVGAVAVFALLTALARTTAYFALDLSITQTLQTIRTPFVYGLMQFISWFGFMPQTIIIPLLFVALVYWFGYHWEALMLFVSVGFISLLNFVVKTFVRRPRPGADLVEVLREVSGYSFPSGHVMFYLALFGFLLFLSFTLLKRSYLRMALVIVFGLMILLVGPSRIYLGDHWASDVLGAYLLGSLGLVLVIWVYRRGKGRVLASQPVAPEPDAGGPAPLAKSSAIPVTAQRDPDQDDDPSTGSMPKP